MNDTAQAHPVEGPQRAGRAITLWHWGLVGAASLIFFASSGCKSGEEHEVRIAALEQEVERLKKGSTDDDGDPKKKAARRKVPECNELMAVINNGIQSLEKGQKEGADPSGTGELKAMAQVMDKVAEQASKVNLTIPELKEFSGQYQRMAKEVARSAREMAEAADAKDTDKMSKAQAAMETAVKQEDPLVDAINKFCAAP